MLFPLKRQRYETARSFYILMEYIMGGTLRSILQARTEHAPPKFETASKS